MDSRFRGNDLPTLANPSAFAKANYEGQVASFVGQSKERICLEHLFVGITINDKVELWQPEEFFYSFFFF
jgi:hypothetical protein